MDTTFLLIGAAATHANKRGMYEWAQAELLPKNALAWASRRPRSRREPERSNTARKLPRCEEILSPCLPSADSIYSIPLIGI